MKSNPFSTRYTAPGRITWLPPADLSLDLLAQRFAKELQGRAAIVGPHGSGKSSLLQHLVPMLGPIQYRANAWDKLHTTTSPPPVTSDKPFESVICLTLRGSHPSLKLISQTRELWFKRGCLLVIDGYEQLGWHGRLFVVFMTKIVHCGLLLTSHRTTLLPTLIQTNVDTNIALRILDILLSDEPEEIRVQLRDADWIQTALEKHQFNMREVLMELYDRVQQLESERNSS